MTIGSLDNFGKSDGENMNPEDFDCSVFFEMYKALFEILDVEVGSFAELLDVYKNVEMDYTLKRHALKQKEILYWFNTDWKEELGKEKPTEKDKEKWIRQKMGYDSFVVEQLEVKLKHIRRMYETALKHSFEAIK